MTLNTHFLIQEKPFDPPVFYTDYKNLGFPAINADYPCPSFNYDGTPEEIINKVARNCATVLAVAENNQRTSEEFSVRIKELVESVKI